MNLALLSLAASFVVPLIVAYYAARFYIYLKTRKGEDDMDFEDIEDGVQKPKVISVQDARGALNVFLIVFALCLGVSGGIIVAIQGVAVALSLVRSALNIKTWVVLGIAIVLLYLAASGTFALSKETSMFLSFQSVKVENDKVYVSDLQGFLRDFGMALVILLVFAIIL